MVVRGEPVTIGVKVAELAITKDMIWLGADVSMVPQPSTPPT
jgi:hypothetical protein